MAKTAFKKTGKWAQLRRALDPRVFDRTSRKHIRRATGINALLAVKSIRDVIGKGDLKPNAPLTIAIKGEGKRPLVDSGDMRQAVTHKMVDDFTAFAGVLKTDDKYNVAVSVHDGVEIGVTNKMRAMFWALWLKSTHRPDMELRGRAADLWDRFTGPWYPIAAKTTAIVVPSRPFVRYGFADPELHRHVQRNWEQAIAATFRELVR